MKTDSYEKQNNGFFIKRYLLLFILLFFLIFLNIITGSVKIPSTDFLSSDIFLKIRLPRLIAAIFLGGALSLSGYLLQTFFDNPIAGPYVLGISSGAKLFVALLMIFFMSRGLFLSSLSMIAAAFLGSLFSTLILLLIAGRARSASVLIICGVMTGYICSAITDIIVTYASDSDIVNLHNWSRGSFSGTDMENVISFTPVIMITFIITFFLEKKLYAFKSGEDYAKSLGVNVRSLKVIIIILSSILSASVTAFAGPVSFLGVATPHIIRLFFKTEKPKVMITGCFLGGAVFCLFCDLIARCAFYPSELSISTVTAVFGAPVVIIMLLSKKKRVEIND